MVQSTSTCSEVVEAKQPRPVTNSKEKSQNNTIFFRSFSFKRMSETSISSSQGLSLKKHLLSLKSFKVTESTGQTSVITDNLLNEAANYLKNFELQDEPDPSREPPPSRSILFTPETELSDDTKLPELLKDIMTDAPKNGSKTQFLSISEIIDSIHPETTEKTSKASVGDILEKISDMLSAPKLTENERKYLQKQKIIQTSAFCYFLIKSITCTSKTKVRAAYYSKYTLILIQVYTQIYNKNSHEIITRSPQQSQKSTVNSLASFSEDRSNRQSIQRSSWSV